jgi:hypothetical protein
MASLLSCRGTHTDYDRQGYSFRLAGQTVDAATITEVITLPVRHGHNCQLDKALFESSNQPCCACLPASLRS